MARISTFCPACGESFEREVTADEHAAGAAESRCPRCGHAFVIRPRKASTQGSATGVAPPGGGTPAGAASSEPAPAGPPQAAPGPAATTPPSPSTPSGSSAPPGGWTSTYAYPSRGPKRTSKPTVAGVLLIFAAVMGLLFGTFLAFLGEVAQLTAQEVEGEVPLEGSVADVQGDALSGVRVSIEGTNASTTSDEEGRYRLDAPAGIRTLRFEKEGYKNHTLRTLVAPNVPEVPQVRMEEGSGDAPLDDLLSGATTRVCGGLILIFGVLAVLGAVSALRRRNWALAMGGAVGGILSFGFIIGSVTALAALVLIWMAKDEFASAKRPS